MGRRVQRESAGATGQPEQAEDLGANSSLSIGLCSTIALCISVLAS
jgi:hypothetical protein